MGNTAKVIIDLGGVLPPLEFKRAINLSSPFLVRAIRDSAKCKEGFFANTEKSDTEKQVAEGILGFLGIRSIGYLDDGSKVENKEYVAQILQNCTGLFHKPHNEWNDEQWQYLAYREAQALLSTLMGYVGNNSKTWGEEFDKLKSEERSKIALNSLAHFFLHAFKVAVTRKEIRTLLQRARADTIPDSKIPSSAPPPKVESAFEAQFQHYMTQFADVPESYLVNYRFACFRNQILDYLQNTAMQTEKETIYNDIYQNTGIPVDTVQKIDQVFQKEPEKVRDGNFHLPNILERDRQIRVDHAVRQLVDGKSMKEIKEITAGLTNVQANNPELPEIPLYQFMTKEGMPAFIYATESRIVTRYPTLEFAMHEVFKKVKSKLEMLKEKEKKEVLSVAAFDNLNALLSSQIENVYSEFYSKFAYHQSPNVLKELQSSAESIAAFHLEKTRHLLPLLEQIYALVEKDFDSKVFKYNEEVFSNKDNELYEILTWLSSAAAAANPVDEKMKDRIKNLGKSCQQVLEMDSAREKYAELQAFLQRYVRTIGSFEDYPSLLIKKEVALMLAKWPTFSDCFEALSVDAYSDQRPKQEIILWLSGFIENVRYLQEKLANVSQQVKYLAEVMCEGDEESSVWKWADQRTYKNQFTLDEDIMKQAWQVWQKNMLDHVLSQQVPDPSKDRNPTCSLVMECLPVYKQEIGHFPSLYPEFWYLDPQSYLGQRKPSVPLSDAIHIAVNRGGKLEKWEIAYALGVIKVRLIEAAEGGRERKSTVFQS